MGRHGCLLPRNDPKFPCDLQKVHDSGKKKEKIELLTGKLTSLIWFENFASPIIAFPSRSYVKISQFLIFKGSISTG